MKKKKLIFLFLTAFALQGCFMFPDAPRDNPLDPKNPANTPDKQEKPTPCNPASECVVPGGLIAWWKFDSDLIDSVGSYSGGSGTTYAFAISDRYGSTGRTLMASTGALTLTNTYGSEFDYASFTLEFWAYFNGTLPVAAVSLVSRHDDVNDEGYKIVFSPSSQIQGYVNATARGYNGVSADTWYHVALVMINDNHTLYVGSYGSAFSSDNDINTYTAYPVNLTLNFDSTNLVIDDLRFYNRALSPAELNQNHNVTQENNRLPP